MSEPIIPPTLGQLKEAILNPLHATAWWGSLRMYLRGGDFDHVLQTLLDEIKNGYRVTPRFKDMFRAFLVTPFDKVKCVIYTEDLSPYVGRHSGLAYDCSLRNRADNPLQAIHKELEATIPGSRPSNSLQHWAEQGVLLLTSELTTTIDTKRSHKALYHSWNNTIFDVFKHDLKNCVFVFIGRGVWDYSEKLHKDSVVFKFDTPNLKFPERWGSNVFNLINIELVKKELSPIVW